MRAILIMAFAALGVALAGCAPKRVATGPKPYDRTVDAGCYTVDLFTPSNVTTPTSDVPAEWHGYLGKWGGGAWEGKWCHDLYVLSISPDGKVDVISAHAPFPEWGREATAFPPAGAHRQRRPHDAAFQGCRDRVSLAKRQPSRRPGSEQGEDADQAVSAKPWRLTTL